MNPYGRYSIEVAVLKCDRRGFVKRQKGWARHKRRFRKIKDLLVYMARLPADTVIVKLNGKPFGMLVPAKGTTP